MDAEALPPTELAPDVPEVASEPTPVAESIVEVAFKGNRKEFFRWTKGDAPRVKARVIVEADRGEDLGTIHTIGDLALLRGRRTAHGYGDTKPELRVLRVASAADVRKADELRLQDETARRQSIERVRQHKLEMKLTDAEWRWDKRKLVLYFSSEKRVDFRDLVRDLAALFRTRIELKQIGVRDEARRLGGIGRCGREYCSAAWLPDLRPVNLGVAKDQRLSLNPTQISGACGRLMCCLRYEHEFYVQQRKRFPKEGKILTTQKGEEKVVAIDIFRERVTLRSPEGEARVVDLADLNRELGAPMPSMADEYTAEFEVPSGDVGFEALEEIAQSPTPNRTPGRGRPADRAPERSSNRPAPGAARGDRSPQPPRSALPVLPTAPTPPATPPAPPASIPAPAATAPDPTDDGDDDGPEDGAPEGSEGTEAQSANGEPKRRRRGRRGGRRHRPGGGSAGPGNTTPPAP